MTKISAAETQRVKRIIHELGGVTTLAKMFNITPVSVSLWQKRGIPPTRLMYLKKVYPNLF